jgi:translation initiation factor IF-2
VIPEAISVQELANRMAERAVDVIRLLMKSGTMVKITDVLDPDTAQLVAEEMGHTVRRVAESDVEEGLFDKLDAEGMAIARPPVVTIMGHVDHGKTSLLDAIRKANVVDSEAGGITQHIGRLPGRTTTAARSPSSTRQGHEAFTAMRARGRAGDGHCILVVAADDGVMPQTVEADPSRQGRRTSDHRGNQQDRQPGADPDARSHRSLAARHRVEIDGRRHAGGGSVGAEADQPRQAAEGILLQAEVLNLIANPDRAAEGIVVEAQLDRGRGPVATVLVQRGLLEVGDIVVAGAEWGRVRALINDRGEQIRERVRPLRSRFWVSRPRRKPGDRLIGVESEARAREITEYRQRQKREKSAARAASARGSLEQMMNRLQVQGKRLFPIVVKGDVQGSVEAIVQALDKLGTEEVGAHMLLSGVGGITESDVSLAAASKAPIIAFNVRANAQARAMAERDGVEIRYYSIIYDLVDDIKGAMSGLLPPERRETFLGYATILEIFHITKVGKIAGCRVTEGKVERGSGVRLLRENVVIHEGKLSTLKRFKDEVREVPAGQECGMAFERYEDMRVGDQIECYRVEHIAAVAVGRRGP